jgi:hypothetical protein
VARNPSRHFEVPDFSPEKTASPFWSDQPVLVFASIFVRR